MLLDTSLLRSVTFRFLVLLLQHALRSTHSSWVHMRIPHRHTSVRAPQGKGQMNGCMLAGWQIFTIAVTEMSVEVHNISQGCARHGRSASSA